MRSKESAPSCAVFSAFPNAHPAPKDCLSLQIPTVATAAYPAFASLVFHLGAGKRRKCAITVEKRRRNAPASLMAASSCKLPFRHCSSTIRAVSPRHQKRSSRSSTKSIQTYICSLQPSCRTRSRCRSVKWAYLHPRVYLHIFREAAKA